MTPKHRTKTPVLPRPGKGLWLWGALLLWLLAQVGFVSLAHWQWQRYQYKLELNSIFAARLAESALDATQLDGTALWRRIGLEGQWQNEQTRFLQQQSLNGQPAVRVLTPLRLADGRQVVVDRGLYPWAERQQTPTLELFNQPGLVQVSGVVRAWPARKGWLTGPDVNTNPRGLLRLSQDQFEQIEPLWVQAGQGGKSLGKPETELAQPVLVPQPEPPQTDPGRHLNYFFTWLILALLWPVLLWRWWRQNRQ